MKDGQAIVVGLKGNLFSPQVISLEKMAGLGEASAQELSEGDDYIIKEDLSGQDGPGSSMHPDLCLCWSHMHMDERRQKCTEEIALAI